MNATPAAGTTAIAVAQFAPGDDEGANLDSIRMLAEAAASRGALLVVFPEYFTTQLLMLGDYKRPIRDQVRAEKEKRDQYLTRATETIRKRIAEFEQSLQEESATILAQKAQLDGQVEAAKHSAAREAARLRAQVERFAEIPAAFVIGRSGES